MSTKKEKKLLENAQQYAVDAAYTYRNIAQLFGKDASYSEPLLKIAEQKDKVASMLEGLSGIQLEAKHSDYKFLKIWKRIFGNASLFKNMAGSENEQGDVLRKLAQVYPQLKPIAQEYYLQSSTLRRLEDRIKKSKKRRKKK